MLSEGLMRDVGLSLQLQGTGVNVSIGFPADMYTDCYKQEQLIKVATSCHCNFHDSAGNLSVRAPYKQLLLRMAACM